MNKRQMGTMLVVAVGLWGCQGPQEEHGGFVLLDQQAREAGFALSGVTMDTARVMPVEVEAPAALTLVAHGKQVEVATEADQLVVVHGAAATVEHRALGVEIDRDRLQLRGSEAAARELAAVLAGTVERRDDGTWDLRATNALAEASRVRAPAGLLEILPGLAEASGPTWNGAHVGLGEPAVVTPVTGKTATSTPGGSKPVDEEPAAHATRVVLLAEDLMPPAVSCVDDVTGTWVSHQYHPDLGQWYVFTAQVRRTAAGSEELVGNMRSEFWYGDIDARTPPVCDGPSSVHGAVTMPAAGSIHDGQVELHGLSWKIEKTTCESGWSGSYLVDKFTGKVEGSRLQSVNNDGGNSIDDATDFRRVRCD